ncbi:MAG: hypothetical protein LBT50_04090 [Prevotellaceae bacterium]|jgi:hypothetical protein|nr:hypothetical protein [Prevotellaceae bacterium]
MKKIFIPIAIIIMATIATVQTTFAAGKTKQVIINTISFEIPEDMEYSTNGGYSFYAEKGGIKIALCKPNIHFFAISDIYEHLDGTCFNFKDEEQLSDSEEVEWIFQWAKDYKRKAYKFSSDGSTGLKHTFYTVDRSYSDKSFFENFKLSATGQPYCMIGIYTTAEEKLIVLDIMNSIKPHTNLIDEGLSGLYYAPFWWILSFLLLFGFPIGTIGNVPLYENGKSFFFNPEFWSIIFGGIITAAVIFLIVTWGSWGIFLIAMLSVLAMVVFTLFLNLLSVLFNRYPWIVWVLTGAIMLSLWLIVGWKWWVALIVAGIGRAIFEILHARGRESCMHCYSYETQQCTADYYYSNCKDTDKFPPIFGDIILYCHKCGNFTLRNRLRTTGADNYSSGGGDSSSESPVYQGTSSCNCSTCRFCGGKSQQDYYYCNDKRTDIFRGGTMRCDKYNS